MRAGRALEVERSPTRTSGGRSRPRASISGPPPTRACSPPTCRSRSSTGDADVVVHSWKDLPIAGHPGTRGRDARARRPARRAARPARRRAARARRAHRAVVVATARLAVRVDPRRAAAVAVTDVRVTPVRGNIPTRLNKLSNGDGDALVVAKAALDRLLSGDSPPETRRRSARRARRCRWMVLPLKEYPTAPAQGALAIEVAADRSDVLEYVFARSNHEPTWAAVARERAILAVVRRRLPRSGRRDGAGSRLRTDRERARASRTPIEPTTWSLESTSAAAAGGLGRTTSGRGRTSATARTRGGRSMCRCRPRR